MRRLSKKNLIHVIALTFIVIGTLIGCGLGGGGKTTIRFWNGFTGPDGRTMLRLVKRFNEENPDVQVLMQRMDWATYYNKLFVAGLGGRAPEVFVLHVDNIERFRRADFIRPVDDLISGKNGIDTSDFSEIVWDAVRYDDLHYGIPLDVHVLGMYYNRRRFIETGLVHENGEPRLPTNREEFIETLSRLTQDRSPEGNLEYWGFVFTWFRTNVFTIMHQFGGRFFSEDGTTCLLNSPENVEALQFCTDLIRKYQVAPPPEHFDAWIGFRQGRVGIAFEGIYMIADLERQKDLDFSGAPLPQLGPIPAAWAGTHTLCLKKDLNDEQLEAAWRFIRFLSDNSLDWAVGGQIPVRISLLKTQRFADMKIQYEFAKQLPYIRYSPRIPFVFEFFMEFDAAVEKALRGSASPKEALDFATIRVNEVIRRQEQLMQDAKRNTP